MVTTSKDICNEDLNRMKTEHDSHVTLKSSPVMHGDASEPVFIYTVYVRHKDHARARQLVLGA